MTYSETFSAACSGQEMGEEKMDEQTTSTYRCMFLFAKDNGFYYNEFVHFRTSVLLFLSDVRLAFW